MKKIIIYVLLLSAVLLLPLQGTDVGKLLPVEVLQIYKENDTLVLKTDVGASGTGATVDAVIRSLKETAAGTIYLDTAEYLLVEEGAKEAVPELKDHLKYSIYVCGTDGKADLKEAAEFLPVHRPSTRLKDYISWQELEFLAVEDGRMILKEN